MVKVVLGYKVGVQLGEHTLVEGLHNVFLAEGDEVIEPELHILLQLVNMIQEDIHRVEDLEDTRHLAKEPVVEEPEVDCILVSCLLEVVVQDMKKAEVWCWSSRVEPLVSKNLSNHISKLLKSQKKFKLIRKVFWQFS